MVCLEIHGAAGADGPRCLRLTSIILYGYSLAARHHRPFLVAALFTAQRRTHTHTQTGPEAQCATSSCLEKRNHHFTMATMAHPSGGPGVERLAEQTDITQRRKQVLDKWNGIKEQTALRRQKLQAALALQHFRRDARELEEWVASQQKVAEDTSFQGETSGIVVGVPCSAREGGSRLVLMVLPCLISGWGGRADGAAGGSCSSTSTETLRK